MIKESIFERKEIIKIALVNLLGILFALFAPILSHSISIPFYYLEPMRLITLIIFISLSKKNGIFYALYMPLLNTLITGHPDFIKSILISSEIVVNLYLLEIFRKKSNLNFHIQLGISIILSKIYYYFVKYVLISFSVIPGRLFTSNLIVQLIFILIIIYIISLSKKLLKEKF